jgi:hypothetical protein
MASDHGDSAPLYEVEWKGRDDYLPDAALGRIAEVVLDRLPDGGFDVPSLQAGRRTVTATIAFDGLNDALSQKRAAEAMFQAATVVRTLHANLVAARAALFARSDGRG